DAVRSDERVGDDHFGDRYRRRVVAGVDAGFDETGLVGARVAANEMLEPRPVDLDAARPLFDVDGAVRRVAALDDLRVEDAAMDGAIGGDGRVGVEGIELGGRVLV